MCRTNNRRDGWVASTNYPSGSHRRLNVTSPYRVLPMPRQVSKATLVQMGMIQTATIGHLTSQGFMRPRISAKLPGARVAGTAVTVSTCGCDSTAVLIAIDALRAGDFLVVDRGGDSVHATIGAVMASAIKAAGAVGVIVDGLVTDLPEIIQIGLPVWCTGVSPLLGRKLNHGGSVNCVISCGEIAVRPGIAILADDSGVVCLEEEGATELLGKAAERERREVEIFARLGRGERLSDITGAPRFGCYVTSEG